MRRLIIALAVALMVAGTAVPAAAHDTGQPIVEDETTPVDRKTDNVELVAHHYFPEGTDMMFQRREGPQVLDGETIDETRDYVFVGGDAKSDQEDGGVQIFDVTDPTNPDHLVHIPCLGYHSEIAVYENLLMQVIDSSGSNGGCLDESFDPLGEDQPGSTGVRVYDITDPANPYVINFLDARDGIEGGTHNATVVPWAGVLYLAQAAFTPTGNLTIIDLKDRSFEVTAIGMQDISPGAADACHDIGLDPERKLAFCAAIASTLVWDISDPMAPSHVSTIVNPKITIHHGARLAPDGVTLVLNDEHAGAADEADLPDDGGVGSNGCVADQTMGAIWFYDTSVPEAPVPLGSYAPRTPEPTASPCTSHFYNFVPGTSKVVVGWYEAGIVVVDFSLPTVPTEDAVFLPELGNYWSAYYWHGYLYGSSRTRASKGFGGGLWVVAMDGLEDADPAPADEGTSWIRWTGSASDETTPAPGATDTSERGEPTTTPLPTTGGGAVLAGLGILGLAGAVARRRRA